MRLRNEMELKLYQRHSNNMKDSSLKQLWLLQYQGRDVGFYRLIPPCASSNTRPAVVEVKLKKKSNGKVMGHLVWPVVG